MANFQYSADIIADALFRAGERTDGTSRYAAEALVQLNRAYEQVYQGGSEVDPGVREDWRWLRATTPGVLVLQPPISTGTVSVTQNSTALTFSSGPAASVSGWFFRVTGEEDIYRIASHTAASTSATLDGTFTGATSASASYTLFKLEYDLASDVLRPIAPMRRYRISDPFEEDYKIHGVDLDALEAGSPLALIATGCPDRFALVGERRVRFNRAGGPDSNDYIRVEYEYLARPAALTGGTTEEPVLPLHRRRILSDLVAAYILEQKNDSRAASHLGAATAGLRGMMLENRHTMSQITSRNFGVFPRQSAWRRGAIRTESGIIILG